MYNTWLHLVLYWPLSHALAHISGLTAMYTEHCFGWSIL